MQNTTSLQPSTLNTIPKHTKIFLNTGFARIFESFQCLKPEETVPKFRDILYREEVLIPFPFGQIKYQSRRSGSRLNCAFSFNDAQVFACAVSGQGRNRQFWEELVTDYSFLQKANGVLGRSGRTLKVPKRGPWIATFLYSSIVFLIEKESDQQELVSFMDNLATVFLIDYATKSVPTAAPVHRGVSLM